MGRDVSPTSPLINERALFLPGQLHTIQLPISPPFRVTPESSILVIRPVNAAVTLTPPTPSSQGGKNAGNYASPRETFNFCLSIGLVSFGGDERQDKKMGSACLIFYKVDFCAKLYIYIVKYIYIYNILLLMEFT